jgi:predicted PurR-regulated permease PerM
MGVVITAIVQSALSGIGLAIAGVPFATILTMVIFILAVAQVGAAPVLIPAVIWVYARSGALWGSVFRVWAIFCGTLDNLRGRPIRRGADLPMLLIRDRRAHRSCHQLFIGPVVLAVAYTLLVEWVSRPIHLMNAPMPQARPR